MGLIRSVEIGKYKAVLESLFQSWRKPAVRILSRVDLGSLVFLLFIIIISRSFVAYFQNLTAMVIGSISGVVILLLVGMKLAKLILIHYSMPDYRQIQFVYFPISLFLALSSVYLVWMLVATVSPYAPTFTMIWSGIIVALPPKLHVGSLAKGYFLEIYKQANARSDWIAFFVQIVVMLLITLVIASNPISSWIPSIFYDVIWLVIPSAAIAFSANLFLLNKDSKLWFVSLMLLTLWSKSFLISGGFVIFGADSGDNAAVIGFLKEGGITPIIDFGLTTWDWRSGSLSSLLYQSNIAFICSAIGLDPIFSSAALALSISSVFMVLGSLSLSKALIKSKIGYKFAALSLVSIAPVFNRWLLTLTPNSLIQCMVFPYLVLVLKSSEYRGGKGYAMLSSVILLLIHPTSLALIIPALLYLSRNIVMNLERDKFEFKASLAFLIIFGIILGAFLLSLPSFTALSELLGLSGLLNSNRYAIEFGIFIFESVFIGEFVSSYLVPTLFGVGALLYSIKSWNRVNDVFSKQIRLYLLISIAVFLEVMILDFFVRSIFIPAWRLWPVSLSLLAIFGAPVYLRAIIKERPVPGSRFRTRYRYRFMVAVAMSIILTSSLAFSGFQSEQRTNLDTMTVAEFNLMHQLIISIDLNDSIILAEFATWRFLMGMMDDWPPTTQTFYDYAEDYPAVWSNHLGMQRVSAFIGLAYYDDLSGIFKLMFDKNVDSVYFISFSRFSGEKADFWYNGKPYPTRLNNIGNVAFENEAGIILRFDRSDFTRFTPGSFIEYRNSVDSGGLDIENGSIMIWANFTDRWQSIDYILNFSTADSMDFGGVYMRYRSSHDENHPVLRVWSVANNGTHIYLEPSIIPSVEYNVQYLKFDENQIEPIGIRLSLDSGSASTPWNGPGIYYYNVSDIFLAPY